MLANLYLHWFDALFHGPQGPARWANAKLVRYADDLVILVSKWNTELTNWVETRLEGKFGLEINREKTRVVEVKRGGESLDFLGYTFRAVFKCVSVGEGGGEGAGEATGDDECKSKPHADSATDWPPEPAFARLGELLQLWLSTRGLVGYRLVRGGPFEGASGAAQSKAVPAAGWGQVA